MLVFPTGKEASSTYEPPYLEFALEDGDIYILIGRGGSEKLEEAAGILNLDIDIGDFGRNLGQAEMQRIEQEITQLQQRRRTVARHFGLPAPAPDPTDPLDAWIAAGEHNAGFVTTTGIVKLPPSVIDALDLPALVRFIPYSPGHPGDFLLCDVRHAGTDEAHPDVAYPETLQDLVEKAALREREAIVAHLEATARVVEDHLEDLPPNAPADVRERANGKLKVAIRTVRELAHAITNGEHHRVSRPKETP